MDRETKKHVIINEIKWWKESHLLPEHYCDYLLALYTEGDFDSQAQPQAKGPERRFQGWLFGLILLFLPAILLVIYFTELSFVLQMLLYGVFCFACIGAVLFYKQKKVFVDGLLSLVAFCLLLMSYEAVSLYFPDSPFVLITMLGLHCILWLGAGLRLRIPYFKIAGIAGLILIVLFSLMYMSKQ
jgi:hypothetical protein